MNTQEDKTRAITSAAWYLRRHDYQILNTSWGCQKGTIDLVAKDGDTLVIAEVEFVTCKASAFLPENTISAAQRAKWENMALEYLAQNDYVDLPLRFDTVEIRKIDQDRCMIKHHVNALGCA